MSPAMIPALAAGVSSIGATTFSQAPATVSSMLGSRQSVHADTDKLNRQMFWNQAKSARHFKGHFRLCANRRNSRRLGRRARVSTQQFPDFRAWIGGSQG